MPEIAEVYGVALSASMTFLMVRHAESFSRLVGSRYFEKYRLKGGSISAFLVAKYTTDLLQNLMLCVIFFVLAALNGIINLPILQPVVIWAFLNPFMIYQIVFISSRFFNTTERAT